MKCPLTFQSLLPIVQGTITVLSGGWGLWERTAILNRPFLSGTLWDTTARFHVWPWPLRFALILNVPAFLSGTLFFWPIDKFAPNLPETVEMSALLPFMLILWYWIGSRLDRRWRASDRGPWIALLTFTSAGLIVSLLPIRWSDFLPCGVAMWLATVIAIIWATRVRAGQVA